MAAVVAAILRDEVAANQIDTSVFVFALGSDRLPAAQRAGAAEVDVLEAVFALFANATRFVSG